MARRTKPILISALVSSVILATICPGMAQSSSSNASNDAFEQNRRLGRGVNLGNALEAPNEGDWGLTLQEKHFSLIEQAGFDSVRIPIRWSAHASQEPPYAIDAAFFKRIDRVIEQALSRDLAAIINIHHYDAVIEQPEEHKNRFLSIWRQIASRYQGQPRSLYFELLNEPHSPMTAEAWNQLLGETIGVIRKTNPDRTLIVGPVQWNAYAELPNLKLPEGDRQLIATFHYYLPFHFTHQGAGWVSDSDQWLGTTWKGDEKQRQTIVDHFNQAQDWAEEHNRPLLLGEFGAYSRAEMPSRARWTAFVRQQAEKRRFSWAYWEFGAGFGVYDRQRNEWRIPLKNALLPESNGE